MSQIETPSPKSPIDHIMAEQVTAISDLSLLALMVDTMADVVADLTILVTSSKTNIAELSYTLHLCREELTNRGLAEQPRG